MDKSEIALKITLAIIDKGAYSLRDYDKVGETFAKIYNEVYSNVSVKEE